MIDGSRAGIVDIAMVGLSNYNGLMPESAAFYSAVHVPRPSNSIQVLDGEPGKVLANFEKFGLKGLGFPENGYAT
ncbi:hypothetical protein O9992_24685 [Vibrio lentus]|nr:hypothetical protein [Vibrio lentus]